VQPLHGPDPNRKNNHRVDVQVGNRLIEVKIGAAALRSVRNGLMQLAYAMTDQPTFEGFLVLPDAAITLDRLRQEWQLAASILRPDILNRLHLCIAENERFVGIPREPDPETQRVLSDVVAAERAGLGSRSTRADASFVVVKILLHHWLTDGRPVTAEWLAQTSGYSYRAVARVVRTLGSLIERQPDRRLRLRWFPRENFSRLLAMSDRARATVRFADRSGHPRSAESHLRRLEKLNPRGVAIGGILGAKSYVPDLDIVGLPRLDLSQHSPKSHFDLNLIEKIDPALKRVEDPLEPATVVGHVIRHADPLFKPREGGLHWADPVECLLDLHEAHLDMQASQFLKALEGKRPTRP
jgi:hypothetical protein